MVFRDEEEILALSPKGYDRCYREDIMPYKQALEIWYLERRSSLVDAKIIVLTALAVIWPGRQMHDSFLPGLPRRARRSSFLSALPVHSPSRSTAPRSALQNR